MEGEGWSAIIGGLCYGKKFGAKVLACEQKERPDPAKRWLRQPAGHLHPRLPDTAPRSNTRRLCLGVDNRSYGLAAGVNGGRWRGASRQRALRL